MLTEQDPGHGRQLLPREAAVRRLLALQRTDRLVTEHVELAARGLGVSERTVWRWLKAARVSGELDRRHKGRFAVTDPLRERLAFWRGNVAALHRELVEAAESGGPPPQSRQTLQRAVERDVLRGDRAGLRRGERARRAHAAACEDVPCHHLTGSVRGCSLGA